jgi:hypothetical protein
MSEMSKSRNLIFISHSTPEDNDFVLWLGSRLASAGYEVWSDVTKLIGGEVFWNDIEIAIRHHSAKVVSVLSRGAVHKPGFLNELTLALQVERYEPLVDFIIPVRLDDIPFSGFPVEIIRRNAIDAYSDGWHKALARIIKKLDEDCVPRDENVATDALSAWSKSTLNISGDLVRRDEALVSNWLPIKAMPLSIRIHSCRPGYQPLRRELYNYPAEIHNRQIISFAVSSALIGEGLEQECEIATDNFLRGGTKGLFQIQQRAAENILTSLVHQAWGQFARSKGLKEFVFANNRFGYFLPLPNTGIERIKFFLPTGTKGSRALIGRSDKRKVYWHYTPELVPNLGRQSRFTILPHVIFTKDGNEPIGDADRMHNLRRTFCRNWWQDRWRDLNFAYLSLLTNGDADFQLPLAPDRSLTIDATLESFLAPVTAQTELESDPKVADMLADDLSDEYADVDDDFSDLEFEEQALNNE